MRILYHMKRRRTLLERYYIWRSIYWRWQRLLFPSPAEIRFLRLMGGKCTTFGRIQPAFVQFPLAIVWNSGKILRHAKMHRETRVGGYYADFGNDLNWFLEIDGTPFHRDVVADFDREVYMREFLRRQKKDMRILRIPAYKLWHQPDVVRAQVIKWLNA